jgi:hypothetical protein
MSLTHGRERVALTDHRDSRFVVTPTGSTDRTPPGFRGHKSRGVGEGGTIDAGIPAGTYEADRGSVTRLRHGWGVSGGSAVDSIVALVSNFTLPRQITWIGPFTVHYRNEVSRNLQTLL